MNVPFLFFLSFVLIDFSAILYIYLFFFYFYMSGFASYNQFIPNS